MKWELGLRTAYKDWDFITRRPPIRTTIVCSLYWGPPVYVNPHLHVHGKSNPITVWHLGQEGVGVRVQVEYCLLPPTVVQFMGFC